MTGKSIKETHASDDTKAEQPGSIPESKEEKGIKGSEAHKEQTGQLAEGEKHDHVKEEEAGTAKGGSETEKVDKKETKEETKSDEPTEKEIEASTEQALVRTRAHITHTPALAEGSTRGSATDFSPCTLPLPLCTTGV